jgi:DNA-binding MarR family transcriptional regulator
MGSLAAGWQVLKVLSKGPRTASQVARRLRLRRQSVQRTINDLRGQGFLEIRPNPDDQRAGLVAHRPRPSRPELAGTG